MIWKNLLFVYLAIGVRANPTDYVATSLTYSLTHVCEQNGGEDVSETMAAAFSFMECMKEVIDMNKYTITRAEANGDPNRVFEKIIKAYCVESAEVKRCFNTFTDSAKPCLNERDRGHLVVAKNNTGEIIDFICYNEAERVSSFFSNGGPECLGERRDSIHTCTRNAMDGNSNNEATRNLSSAQKCAKQEELSTCIVTSLEQCSNATPAQIMQSIFNIFRKRLFCDEREQLD